MIQDMRNNYLELHLTFLTRPRVWSIAQSV